MTHDEMVLACIDKGVDTHMAICNSAVLPTSTVDNTLRRLVAGGVIRFDRSVKRQAKWIRNEVPPRPGGSDGAAPAES